MINQTEYEICKKRGHSFRNLLDETKWSRCKWCGVWSRREVVIMEQEETPPKDSISIFEEPKED